VSRSPSHSLRAVARFREDLATQRQALSDNVAALQAENVELVKSAARLRRTGLDLRAGHPPVWMLLDNMHHLMFRRAYRDSGDSSQRPVLLFYGRDVSAVLGHAPRQQRPTLEAWYRRVHRSDRDAYRAAEHARAQLGKGYIIEYRYKHALSGEYRWARETAAAPYDTASGRRLFDSYILDITEQKRAEAALRMSEERYRAVVEDQTEYIRRFDRDRRLTFVNGALCALLQRRREDLLGVDYLQVLPEVEPNMVHERLRSLTPAHPAVSYELQVALPDGTRRWHEWTDRGIFDEAGRLREYQSVGRDITERRRAEQQARYLAQHDPLTHLPNRALLEDHLQYALGQARRDQRQIAVLLLDLDGPSSGSTTRSATWSVTGCCAP
jgi:PAS domain S-box-containing protein